MKCPCLECTTRTAIPNCHGTCEKYLKFADWREAIRVKRQLAIVGDCARVSQLHKLWIKEYKQRRK